MPRCGVKDKVGMDMSKNHTENPNHRHPRRSKRYALQGRNILLILHRVAFCQFIFRWIYYCHSSKSAAPERKLAKRSSVHVQCFLLIYHVHAYLFLTKLPILLTKKTTKREGGGQKTLILRRHSLWTAPN